MLGFPVSNIFYGVINTTHAPAKQASPRNGAVHEGSHQSIVSVGFRKFLPEIFARSQFFSRFRGRFPWLWRRLFHNLILTKINNRIYS
jgi:hypothetical protein